MKDFLKKVGAILTDIEAILVFAAIIVIGSAYGLVWGWLAGVAVYVVVNLLAKPRKRANLFGITPPGDDPPNRPPPEGEE